MRYFFALTLAICLSACSSPTESADKISANECDWVNQVQGFASLDGGTTGGADQGEGNHVVSVTNGRQLNEVLSKKNKIYKDKPLIVYVDGLITWENTGNMEVQLRRSNVSIIGRKIGEFHGVGIKVSHGARNIVIRNLLMHEVPQSHGAGDHIHLDGSHAPVSNIWIDHNEFFNDLKVDKDYYDELVSGRSRVNNLTISYNYFHDSQKTSLWGSSDDPAKEDVGRRISFHHNYWKNVNSRLPLFRFGEGHIWNSYYSGIKSSGINSREGAKMRIENNVFENSKNPILSADSEHIGYWHASGNIFNQVKWNGPFDADCKVGPCYAAGNNSTTDYRPAYDYALQDATQVKAYVMANAGRGKIDACLNLDKN